MTEIRLELVFPSFLCLRISNGLWSFKVYTRFALGSNAPLKVRTQYLPCTMHGSPQLQPRSSREGAGLRFRPLKVDDPESFGCEAAEPIRMHSLETRPLLCLYWQSRYVDRNLGQTAVAYHRSTVPRGVHGKPASDAGTRTIKTPGNSRTQLGASWDSAASSRWRDLMT